MTVSDVHYKTGTTGWGTPQDFFDNLNDIFEFELDVCASPENAKCENFFTEEQDGLSQEWKGVCWCNPPYGRGIGRWIQKAYESSMENDATVVCLVPARTDTKWFENCWKAPFLVFVRGRLKFQGAETSAPFPSCVVVFGKNLPPDLDISYLSGEGAVCRTIWPYNPIDSLRHEWMKEAKERRLAYEREEQESGSD